MNYILQSLHNQLGVHIFLINLLSIILSCTCLEQIISLSGSHFSVQVAYIFFYAEIMLKIMQIVYI